MMPQIQQKRNCPACYLFQPFHVTRHVSQQLNNNNFNNTIYDIKELLEPKKMTEWDIEYL